MQPVAVVAPICQQGLARPDARQYVHRGAPIMRLTLGQLQPDRAANGIDQRVDLSSARRVSDPCGRIAPLFRAVLMNPDG